MADCWCSSSASWLLASNHEFSAKTLFFVDEATRSWIINQKISTRTITWGLVVRMHPSYPIALIASNCNTLTDLAVKLQETKKKRDIANSNKNDIRLSKQRPWKVPTRRHILIAIQILFWPLKTVTVLVVVPSSSKTAEGRKKIGLIRIPDCQDFGCHIEFEVKTKWRKNQCELVRCYFMWFSSQASKSAILTLASIVK